MRHKGPTIAETNKRKRAEAVRRVAELVLPMKLAEYNAAEAAVASMKAARDIVAKWEEMEQAERVG
jgi:hypothetical protein